MSLQRHVVDFEKLSLETLKKWCGITSAIVSDCMNRTHFMSAAIKPFEIGLYSCWAGSNSHWNGRR